jgi:hypothetical protein
MALKDLLLTPLYLPFILLLAVWLRTKMTDSVTRRYFLPGLFVKMIGAVALGVIYQFYYGGGDTFNFFHDSNLIWEAFLNDPFTGLELIVADNNFHTGLYQYTSRMHFYVDPYTYQVVRLSGFFGLFTFHTYTLIAILFAFVSFTGVWALYKVFYDLYPHLHKQIALAVLFMPSVFFWGSGLMKDTITLGALGWLFHAFYFGVIRRRSLAVNGTMIILCILIIKAIKVYILLCFLPAAFLWIFLEYRAQIKSPALRFISLPLVVLMAVPLSYQAIVKVTEENKRYQLENITTTTQVTATWLQQVGTMQSGSVYSLGEFDGTWTGMLSKAPQAIFVTLYRPFLWESRNPVMLLSALEAAFFLFMTLKMLWRVKLKKLGSLIVGQPLVLFCLLFAITFAFAVGVSSYNFGTLVRYKIPMMPFFLVALYVMQGQAVKKRKKVRRFA